MFRYVIIGIGPLICGLLVLAANAQPTERITSDEREVERAMVAYYAWKHTVLDGEEPLQEDWQRELRTLWEDAARFDDWYENDLRRRIVHDQFGRRVNGHYKTTERILSVISYELDDAHHTAFEAALQADLQRIEVRNLGWLKARLSANDGEWWKASELGSVAARRLSIIVQHGNHDRAFQRHVLSLIEPLLTTGEADPSDYAYLYDRLAVAEGSSKHYGSHGECGEGGSWTPKPLEDASRVEEWRAEVGLEPLGEYAHSFSERRICGG